MCTCKCMYMYIKTLALQMKYMTRSLQIIYQSMFRFDRKSLASDNRLLYNILFASLVDNYKNEHFAKLKHLFFSLYMVIKFHCTNKEWLWMTTVDILLVSSFWSLGQMTGQGHLIHGHQNPGYPNSLHNLLF